MTNLGAEYLGMPVHWSCLVARRTEEALALERRCRQGKGRAPHFVLPTPPKKAEKAAGERPGADHPKKARGELLVTRRGQTTPKQRKRTRNYVPKKRVCLACDRLFKSEGPQNRICPECKQLIRVLGYAPNQGVE
jgi:hypothetical protein